ncbi:hypothetical protein [Caulobacter sp.]|uniref:hypothetical protein n=1 Tax=Caulobacter sp. TaxID=78 RepID=UPI003BA92DC6
MEYLVGALLALAVGVFATVVGFDRDKAFYPVVLAVIASYYMLFAIMGGARDVMVVEAVILGGFLAVSVAGFRSSLWLVVAALLGHGVLDVFHPHLITNPGAPAWWPMFCLAFDLVAAGYLAARLRRTSVAAVRP